MTSSRPTSQIFDDAGGQQRQEGCEDDRCAESKPPIWHCVDCDSSYCSICWPLQQPHNSSKRGRDGVRHEKVELNIVHRLRAILTPSEDVEEIRRLHKQDERTKWFGVVRDLTGPPVLEDYGRYATLMSGTVRSNASGSQFPQLVSFIGVTNAGKSTLIKMLIQHGDAAATPFPSPIVGSTVHGDVPTSGDVHLYADPSTYGEQLPMLYADCEGFEGGERVPLGSLTRMRGRLNADEREEWEDPVFRRRPIHWARTDESRRREHAVMILYPRLLYTFSDCIVFVLRNPKTFQSSVLTRLLDWGVTAMEMSLNQPALPHCVVVLNGSDPGIDVRQWDVHHATESLLATVNGGLDHIEGVPRFRQLANHWRRLGRHIASMEDLILCYYRSFMVVRIPHHPQYMLMNEQIGKLHAIIRQNCVRSARTKQHARMLNDADEMGSYLQSGFDHFAVHFDLPFNFMQTALRHNPIPSDFGGHILQLCATLNSRFMPWEVKTVRWMFQQMSTMLASCVLLDCVRSRKGHVDQLFASYECFFHHAVEEYLELHSPCTYRSPDGARSCVLVKVRHSAKGHQDERGVIATGDHIAAFDWRFVSRWIEQLKEAVDELHRTFVHELGQAAGVEEGATRADERIAWDLHAQTIPRFYQAVGPATLIVSHSTCFCCMIDVPQHMMPCKHVLCDACVHGHGKRRKRGVVLANCPLHPEDSRWETPAVVRYTPAGAGIRILSLDGGGIRGIAQLELLRAIEEALGGHMRVQSFFDLIVGAGTGGLIAVALWTEGQTIGQCLDMFIAMCQHAYTPRLALASAANGPALVRQIGRVLHLGPRYKTLPLYEALKTTFTDDASFFGASGQYTSQARVAVTSTADGDSGTTLLANYRRPNYPRADFNFYRVHDPALELKTWQCVAATMSDPMHKPLVAHDTLYRGAGVYCTNPARLVDREARLISLDVHEPDILLSLGTGQHQATTMERLRNVASGRLQSSTGSALQGPSHRSRIRAQKRGFGGGDDILWAEQDWQEFKAAETARLHGKGLIRLNPDIGKEPPAQDRKDQLRMFREDVRARLQDLHLRKVIDQISQRLIATAFYLDVQSQSMDEKGATVLEGSIACRFDDGTTELSALGRVLDQRVRESFEPYFSVRHAPDATSFHSRITVTHRKITRMVDDAVFERPNVFLRLDDYSQAFSINLFLSVYDGLEPEGFPISGFPRGIVRQSSSISEPHSASIGIDDWAGQGARDSPTFSESVFSRHPAHMRGSASTVHTSCSSLTASTASDMDLPDARQHPQVRAAQSPSDEAVTPIEDPQLYSSRRDTRTEGHHESHWRLATSHAV